MDIGGALWTQSLDGMLIIRAGSGIVVDANPTALGWFGADLHELQGTVLAKLLGTERLQPISDAHPENSPEPIRVALTRGDHTRHLELTTLRLEDESSLIVLRDVSAWQREHNELLQKRSALEESINGYDIVDTQGRLVYANRAYLDMWGYESLDEVVGKPASNHCADPNVPRRIIEALESQGRTTIEFEGIRRDGSTFDVLMSAQVSTNGLGERIYVGTSWDMSDVNALREELQHYQRIEALGGLAASVAHDFNNMLVPMLGFSDLILRDSGLTEQHRDKMEKIHLAAKRSRTLTAQLLAFSRKQVIAPRPTDLLETVGELREMIRRTLREDIELRILPNVHQCCVLVDPTQLHQIILNLTINAQDAMPHGGCLTVEVGHTTLESDNGGAIDRELVSEGDAYGVLRISDTGSGMDSETQARVFEPFFSTKGELGTGLGLASVHGIVRQHNGFIEVESNLGEGTSFEILLPLSQLKPQPKKALPRPTELPEVQCRVMIVEDDSLVREVATQILLSNGFDVRGFADAQEALRWIQTTSDPADLLLTDVILPDSNGHELAEACRSSQPELRILYMSGYADSLIDKPRLDGGFLSKPFSAEELLEHVHQATRTTDRTT